MTRRVGPPRPPGTHRSQHVPIMVLGWMAVRVVTLAAEGSVPGAVAVADRSAAVSLWPGFDPRTIPLAVYDGRSTWLFRHPHPPAGFVRQGEAWTVAGRHPALTANNAVELGGVLTAGVLLDPRAMVDERALAGTLIHEAFHAFQARRHPDWSANEAALFEYPLTDGALLALRRLEARALLRALGGGADAGSWARTALALRRERFGRLPPEAVAYERHTELKEGLAQYVEDRATGRSPATRWPSGEFPPDGIRWRGYASGQALAVLLDRHQADWKDEVEAQGGHLDDKLQRALGAGPSADFASERQAVAEQAERDAAALYAAHEGRRKQFLEAKGLRLEVAAAPAAPLFPQGFDPLNVITLPDRAVLHTRFLKLGNAAGTIEVLGRMALTDPAGRHPLFEGVRRLVITGLPDGLDVRDRGGAVTIEAEGLKADLRGARVTRGPRVVQIELRSVGAHGQSGTSRP